jgi:hypothetical protein
MGASSHVIPLTVLGSQLRESVFEHLLNPFKDLTGELDGYAEHVS